MPTLPINGPTPLDGGVLPVNIYDDVLAVFPADVRRSLTAPVRDALVAGLTEILKEYQRRSRRTAALLDILRATGSQLEALAAEHGVFKQPAESDEALRSRVLGIPDLVSPAAILAVVNSLIAPLTSKRAQYFEASLDRLFISDGTATWHSFIGAAPQYQDRLFPDDIATNGVARTQSDPGKAWLFSDSIGRFFVLRVPDLAGLDQNIQLVYDGTPMQPGETVPELGGATPPFAGSLQPGQVTPSAGGTGLYIANGSNASGSEADGSVATFLFSNTTDALSTYQTIVSAVDLIRGQSMRWSMIVDVSL